MSGRMAALIAAHDEAAVLGATLASLRAATPPPEAMIVVADHCSDDTAGVARAGGALVFERAEGEGSKGAALRWLLDSFPPPLAECDGVAVFDADSTVNPEFFAHLQFALAAHPAAQAYVQPTGYAGSPAATLAAYSEVLSQVADDALRARWRWPVPLRGTGMAFRTPLLRELLAGAQTRTEDIELSLALAERGQRAVFVRPAVVFDPKPAGAARVARQRARWLQGQAEVWRQYGGRIARLLARGPGVWWLLGALLLKPKTLFVFLKLLALGAVLILPAASWLRLLLAVPVLADAFYYGLGLLLVPAAERAPFARALVAAPLFGLVWLASGWTALRERGGWLSARH